MRSLSRPNKIAGWFGAVAVLPFVICISQRASSSAVHKGEAHHASRHVTYSTPDYIYPSDNGYYNVKDKPYGCHGDGRHDDTACIKAAMDAAMRVRAPADVTRQCIFPKERT